MKVLLVNIFAGITDLGEFSKLLVAALAAVPRLKVPVVARLVGNGLPRRAKFFAGGGLRCIRTWTTHSLRSGRTCRRDAR